MPGTERALLEWHSREGVPLVGSSGLVDTVDDYDHKEAGDALGVGSQGTSATETHEGHHEEAPPNTECKRDSNPNRNRGDRAPKAEAALSEDFKGGAGDAGGGVAPEHAG